MDSDNSIASAAPALMASSSELRARIGSDRIHTNSASSEADHPEPPRVSGKAFRNFTMGLEAAADDVSDTFYDTDEAGADALSTGSRTPGPASRDSSPKRLRLKEMQPRRPPAATVSDVSSFTKSLKVARNDDVLAGRSLSVSASGVARSPSYLDLESEIDDLLGNGTN